MLTRVYLVFICCISESVMAFVKGVSGNPQGRRKVIDAEKPTNRSNRTKELLLLVRKLKPIQTKAIQAAVNILDNKESSENGKLRSAALIIQTYKDLIKETYDYRYDEAINEPMQEDNKPVFSLKIVNTEE